LFDICLISYAALERRHDGDEPCDLSSGRVCRNALE